MALVLVLPFVILVASMAAAAWLDVRRGGRPRAAWLAVLPAAALAWVGLMAARAGWLAGSVAVDPRAMLALGVTASIAVGALAVAAKLLPPRPELLLASALPFLVFPFGMTVLVPDGRSPWPFAAGCVAAAALWPWALSRGLLQKGWRQALAVAAGAGLGGGLVAGAFVLLVSVGEGGAGSEAVHRWTLAVEPEDEDANWTLEAPFLVLAEPSGAAGLAALTETLAVKEGRASFALDARGVLVVQGEGRVVVEARHAFFGGADREAFHAWRIASAPFLLNGAPRANVTWEADLSGGTGHTCWARDAFTLQLVAGEPAAARLMRGDGRVQAACA